MKRLPRDLKTEWKRTKGRLADPNTPKYIKSLDFKRWRHEDQPGIEVWSVRVGLNSGYRAHIDHYSDGRWIADRVGDKTDMGH